MLILGLYLIIILIALSWVALDGNATSAFEIFNRNLHPTARQMGMYWEWAFGSLLRVIFLATLVMFGIVASTWMQQENSWGFGWNAKSIVFSFMLISSLALFALPHLSVHFRLKRFLYFKAEELTNLVSIVSSKEGIRQHLEPAEFDSFHGEDGWTAWHPSEEGWNENPLWEGLVPVVYMHQEAEPSLIVPVDWEYFLVWKLPSGSITPGNLMPICPCFTVKAVHNLRGREGWSVVQADMEVDEENAWYLAST